MAIYQEKDKNNKVIYTKDKRSWYFRVYYTDLYGNKKQYRSKYYQSKKNAEEGQRKFLNKNDYGIKEATRKITLDELFSEYEKYRTSSKNKDSSNYSDYINYNNHISPILGKEDVRTLTLLDIRRFQDYMSSKTYKKNKPYSYQFKTKIHSLLSCIIDYGVSMGYVYENVAKRYGNFKHKNDEVISKNEDLLYQTPLEFDRFMSVVDQFKWRVWFSFLYWTGCRKGEIQAITFKDIDFDNNLIIINKNLSNKIKGGGYKITNTKNRKSRIIALLPQLRPILLEWCNYNKRFQNYSDDWFLFGNTTYYANTTIDNIKKQYYDKLESLYPNEKITRLTIHQFGRHSHASLLISLGVTDQAIAKRLGDTVEVIRKTYAHLFPTYNDDILSIVTDEKIDVLNEKMKKYL